MLHVISACCVVHDLYSISPRPLERGCWKQFMAQWGDCNNHELCFSMWLLLLLLVVRDPLWEQQTWGCPCSPSLVLQVSPILQLQWLPCQTPGLGGVTAGTGWFRATILWWSEIETFLCNFCLSGSCTLSYLICPWNALACCSDIQQPTNNLQETITELVYYVLFLCSIVMTMQFGHLMGTMK